MHCRNYLPIVAALLLCGVCLADSPQSSKDNSNAAVKQQPMNGETRMLVIRSLTAEFVFTRRMLPMGMKGLTIKHGDVTPNDADVKQLALRYGPAAKPGDRVQITNVDIK